MTPEQKAMELVSKFTFLKLHEDDAKFYNPKQCALIACDYIINSSPSLPILSSNGTFGSDIEESTKYWQSVKKSITEL